VGQGGGDGQLHFHAPGEVLKLFGAGNVKAGQVAFVQGLVPPGIGQGHQLTQLQGGDDLGQAGLVQHHPDVLLGLEKVRALVVGSQQGNLPVLPGRGVHQELQSGGFSRSVFPHQPQDAAGGEGEGDVVQGKALVGLGQVPASMAFIASSFP